MSIYFKFLLQFSAEEAVQCQLDALKDNDQPRQDYGIEVMYRVTSALNPVFAGYVSQGKYHVIRTLLSFVVTVCWI